MAVAVDFGRDRFTRQPSPSTPAGPEMEMAACLPRGDTTTSFMLPFWMRNIESASPCEYAACPVLVLPSPLIRPILLRKSRELKGSLCILILNPSRGPILHPRHVTLVSASRRDRPFDDPQPGKCKIQVLRNVDNATDSPKACRMAVKNS